ncbi:hypothetical protein [Streptomyces sp. NPDC001401]
MDTMKGTGGTGDTVSREELPERIRVAQAAQWRVHRPPPEPASILSLITQ